MNVGNSLNFLLHDNGEGCELVNIICLSKLIFSNFLYAKAPQAIKIIFSCLFNSEII